jgi:hypothetical protein
MKSKSSPIRPTRSAPHSRAPAGFWELKICDFTIFGMKEFPGYLKWAGQFPRLQLFQGTEVGPA